MTTITIDQTLCNVCGVCGRICPRYIPETVMLDGTKVTRVSPERADLCMACGHCMAVCPNGAIAVEGLDPAAFRPVEERTVPEESFLTLLRQRRSVRRYKEKAVPRPVIERILAAAQCAPTASGQPDVGLIVIDRAETLAKFSALAFDLYGKLETGLKNPVARVIIQRSAGKAQLRTLREFVMPGMHWYLRWYRQGQSNEILRDCRALMLFHSPVHAPAAAENCLIAAFHAILMAEVVGVGTCFNDLIPPVCNRSAAARDLLGLPEGHEVYASLTMGYPKYDFKQVPPRKLMEVRYLD